MKLLERTILIIVIIIVSIATDFWSKELTRDKLEYHQTVDVIGDFFVLVKVENTGAFLGMGSSLTEIQRWILLIILPVIVLFSVCWYLFKNQSLNLRITWALALIIGGGMGNIFDRVKLRDGTENFINRLSLDSVTDMMFLDFGFAHTGIFNLADVFVMVGTGLILLDQFLPKKKEEGKLQES